LDKALHNYEAGLKALARRIARSMHSDKSNPILQYRNTRGQRWIEQATYAALWIVSLAPDIDAMAWPTGEQAMEEERTEPNGGLYWLDKSDEQNKRVRLFLPNYFTTFREELKRDRAYATLIGNCGTVLQLLGNENEAQQHFQEAMEFLPD
jgi:hypothetical protein